MNGSDQQKPLVIRRKYYGCSQLQTEYTILGKLGEGTFGEVHKARQNKTGDIVALKKILMHNEKEGFPITALREIKILKSLSNVNVIPLIDMAVERANKGKRKKATVSMVSPYMDHDLSGLLENPAVTFTVGQIKCYMLQLLEGTKYLHDSHILHRDMKAANLLIDNSGILRIADFGLARRYQEDPPKPGQKYATPATREYTNCVVTRWYRPPELLLGAKMYTTAIDMWGVGCVFAEMYRRKPILTGNSDLDQIHKIFELCGTPDDNTWPGWRNISKAATELPSMPHYKRTIEVQYKDLGPQGVNLLCKLLSLNPSKRITAVAAIDDEFFHTNPLPSNPSSLPMYESSHELDRKKFRAQKEKMGMHLTGPTNHIGHSYDIHSGMNIHKPTPPHRYPPIQGGQVGFNRRMPPQNNWTNYGQQQRPPPPRGNVPGPYNNPIQQVSPYSVPPPQQHHHHQQTFRGRGPPAPYYEMEGNKPPPIPRNNNNNNYNHRNVVVASVDTYIPNYPTNGGPPSYEKRHGIASRSRHPQQP